MRLHRIIERAVKLPAWDEAARQRSISYWTDQGFQVKETSPYTLIGKRGNLIGNLISFDMKNLMANLAITWDEDNQLLHMSFRVNTVMQQITEWNEEYWKLEMDSFESCLLNGDKKEQTWAKFLAAYNKASLKWTFGAGGKKIAPGERTW